MTDRLPSPGQLQPNADAQTIAIYVMRKMMSGGGGAGNVQGIGTSTDGNFPVYDGATGKKIRDDGWSPASFVQESENRRYVANGETQTVAARRSRYIVHDFEIESGGTLVIEADGNMEVG